MGIHAESHMKFEHAEIMITHEIWPRMVVNGMLGYEDLTNNHRIGIPSNIG